MNNHVIMVEGPLPKPGKGILHRNSYGQTPTPKRKGDSSEGLAIDMAMTPS